jgi:hypothetical protein
MKSYRAVPNPEAEDGSWVVECSTGGTITGYIADNFQSEAEAQFRVYMLARTEAIKDPP